MGKLIQIFFSILHIFTHYAPKYTKSESTKQMEPILRAKVKIFFKSENSKKKILIKDDGHIMFK